MSTPRSNTLLNCLLAAALILAPLQGAPEIRATLDGAGCEQHAAGVDAGLDAADPTRHVAGNHLSHDSCTAGHACSAGHCPACVPGVGTDAPSWSERSSWFFSSSAAARRESRSTCILRPPIA